jgi:hypothetical protein
LPSHFPKTAFKVAKDNRLREVDLGLVNSSAANDFATLVINRLRQDGDIEASISPAFLTRNWPPAFVEWSTKSVRDAFFAAPQFPRLLTGEAIKETIARGVSSGLLAYVGKGGNGYEPFSFGRPTTANDVEISDDMYIVTKETAESYLARQKPSESASVTTADRPKESQAMVVSAAPQQTAADSSAPAHDTGAIVDRFTWSGEVPAQKWMNFYTKVLSRFATSPGLRLTVHVDASPPGGLSAQKVEEANLALRELGLSEQ